MNERPDKAFVDTSVLVDALFEKKDRGRAALQALACFKITELPQYAIKELKTGPLSYIAWLHNKLVDTGSFADTLEACRRLYVTPRKHHAATALEALETAAREMGRLFTPELLERYGRTSLDKVHADLYRYAVARMIRRAWGRRRTLTTRVTHALECYAELDPFKEKGRINVKPTACKTSTDCSLAKQMRPQNRILRKLRNAVRLDLTRDENKKRSQVLETLIKRPRERISDNACRRLGDAVFAFLAPEDSVILTTNTRDHEPLAMSIGKRVISPAEVNSGKSETGDDF